jgi:hypothetical protein
MNTSPPLHRPSPSLRIQPRPLRPGTHLARCSAIIDLGTHADQGGKATRRLLLTFTLFAQDGSTQRLSRRFTYSCDVRSSLSKFLTPWLGDTWKTQHGQCDAKRRRCPNGLRVSAIAETACLLVIQPSASTNATTGLPYLNISSASPLIPGITVPDLKWPATLFTLKAPNRSAFQALPAWIQSKIRASAEWQRLKQTTPPARPFVHA